MRSFGPIVLGVAVGLGAAVAPAPAGAQQAGARPLKAAPESRVKPFAGSAFDAPTAEAQRRYQEGNAAVKAGHWERAYQAYLAAWGLKRHWQIAGSLGQVEIKLFKYRDAAEHLALFLREGQGVDAEETKRARGWLDEAKEKVGVLIVTVDPPGAEILVDGVKIGEAPLAGDVYVDPGKHLVEGRLAASAASAASATSVAKGDAELRAGQSKEIALRCAPEIAAPPPASKPADRVVGSKRSFPVRKAVLIGGAGVTAASLGLGIASVVVAADRGRAAREGGEGPTGDASKAEARFKNVAFASFLTAAIAGGATGIYWATTSPRGAPRVQGSVLVSPAGMGAVIRGEF